MADPNQNPYYQQPVPSAALGATQPNYQPQSYVSPSTQPTNFPQPGYQPNFQPQPTLQQFPQYQQPQYPQPQYPQPQFQQPAYQPNQYHSGSYPVPNSNQPTYYPPSDINEKLLDPIKEKLLTRGFHYDIQISKWFDESWHFFVDHWIVFVIFTLVFLGIQFIPYVGPFIVLGMAPGYFIFTSHAFRPVYHGFQVLTMLHGYFLYFPILWIAFLYDLAVSIGIFLLIIPGLYLAIAFSFAIPLWIEYRQEGLGIIDSFSVSRQVVTRQFWGITLLLLAQCGLIIIGVAIFIIGGLVTIPLAMLMHSFAFRDIFTFSEKRHFDHGLVCCV